MKTGRTSLEIDIVTIFPSFFSGPLRESLLGKAQQRSLLEIRVRNLRDYTHDAHKSVDDKPYGGGPGMVMMAPPIFECVETIRRKKSRVILLDPKGERLTQRLAEKLAVKRHLILIAGHYEGVDERVRAHLADQTISVGDFVTMGGEAPALCLIEAVARFIPGVLGNQKSLQEESFQEYEFEYPQYTRPRNFRGWEVPEVLVSGNHQKVAAWRKEASGGAQRRRRGSL